MSLFWITMLVIGLTVIGVLSWYAISLMKKLKAQTQQQQAQELQKKIALKQHDHKIFDSVVIIVRAMKEEQCDMSEGCWRLAVLLDSLKLGDSLSEKFPAIYALYNQIKHMPILEERKKLAKKERMSLDLQRMKTEATLESDIKVNIEQLHQYALEQQNQLTN